MCHMYSKLKAIYSGQTQQTSVRFVSDILYIQGSNAIPRSFPTKAPFTNMVSVSLDK